MGPIGFESLTYDKTNTRLKPDRCENFHTSLLETAEREQARGREEGEGREGYEGRSNSENCKKEVLFLPN